MNPDRTLLMGASLLFLEQMQKQGYRLRKPTQEGLLIAMVKAQFDLGELYSRAAIDLHRRAGPQEEFGKRYAQQPSYLDRIYSTDSLPEQDQEAMCYAVMAVANWRKTPNALTITDDGLVEKLSAMVDFEQARGKSVTDLVRARDGLVLGKMLISHEFRVAVGELYRQIPVEMLTGI